jgi:hypothetical protein
MGEIEVFYLENKATSCVEAICFVEDKMKERCSDIRIEYADSDFDEKVQHKGIKEYEDTHYKNAMKLWFDRSNDAHLYRVYTGGVSYGDVGFIGFKFRTEEVNNAKTPECSWGAWKN